MDYEGQKAITDGILALGAVVTFLAALRNLTAHRRLDKALDREHELATWSPNGQRHLMHSTREEVLDYRREARLTVDIPTGVLSISAALLVSGPLLIWTAFHAQNGPIELAWLALAWGWLATLGAPILLLRYEFDRRRAWMRWLDAQLPKAAEAEGEGVLRYFAIALIFMAVQLVGGVTLVVVLGASLNAALISVLALLVLIAETLIVRPMIINANTPAIDRRTPEPATARATA